VALDCNQARVLKINRLGSGMEGKRKQGRQAVIVFLIESATITPRYVEYKFSTASGFPIFELTLQGALAK
jgi:hypothetical protein